MDQNSAQFDPLNKSTWSKESIDAFLAQQIASAIDVGTTDDKNQNEWRSLFKHDDIRFIRGENTTVTHLNSSYDIELAYDMNCINFELQIPEYPSSVPEYAFSVHIKEIRTKNPPSKTTTNSATDTNCNVSHQSEMTGCVNDDDLLKLFDSGLNSDVNSDNLCAFRSHSEHTVSPPPSTDHELIIMNADDRNDAVDDVSAQVVQNADDQNMDENDPVDDVSAQFEEMDEDEDRDEDEEKMIDINEEDDEFFVQRRLVTTVYRLERGPSNGDHSVRVKLIEADRFVIGSCWIKPWAKLIKPHKFSYVALTAYYNSSNVMVIEENEIEAFLKDNTLAKQYSTFVTGINAKKDHLDAKACKAPLVGAFFNNFIIPSICDQMPNLKYVDKAGIQDNYEVVYRNIIKLHDGDIGSCSFSAAVLDCVCSFTESGIYLDSEAMKKKCLKNSTELDSLFHWQRKQMCSNMSPELVSFICKAMGSNYLAKFIALVGLHCMSHHCIERLVEICGGLPTVVLLGPQNCGKSNMTRSSQKLFGLKSNSSSATTCNNYSKAGLRKQSDLFAKRVLCIEDMHASSQLTPKRLKDLVFYLFSNDIEAYASATESGRTNQIFIASSNDNIFRDLLDDGPTMSRIILWIWDKACMTALDDIQVIFFCTYLLFWSE